MEQTTSSLPELIPAQTNLRVFYLIRAYLDLESTANRDLSTATAEKIESALALVQLLGTPPQIGLAQRFIEQFVENRSGSFDTLLEELRQDIRTQLGLESQPGIRLLRIGIPPAGPTPGEHAPGKPAEE